MIKKAPLATDSEGKCTRWHVVLWNKQTQKKEWHTVHGAKKDAQDFARDQETRLGNGTYVSRAKRLTVNEVAQLFVTSAVKRGLRAGSLKHIESVLDCHVLPKLGAMLVTSVTDLIIEQHFADERKAGKSTAAVNRGLKQLRALLKYAKKQKLVAVNVAADVEPYARVRGERRAARGSFTETEVQAILAAATPMERSLIGLLVFTGMRPGEVYGLDWTAVDLEAGALRVVQSWCPVGKQMNDPKTEAGQRTIPLSAWLVQELRRHAHNGTTGLVFPSKAGTPRDPSSARRDVWVPLRLRAGVRALDLYSLRHTFASLACNAGEAEFNVARLMGHTKSDLVRKVYAHSLPSGVASIAQSVTARALDYVTPKLRVIPGGKGAVSRAGREPVEETSCDGLKKSAK